MHRLSPLFAAALLGACGGGSPACPEGTAPVEGACLAVDAGAADGGVAPDAEVSDAGADDAGAADAAAPDASGADAGCTARTFYRDLDGDGWGDADDSVSACEVPAGYVDDDRDCDDECDSCYPGGTEVCDGHDNDCDDEVDEGVERTFYRDADGDGHGDPATTATGCAAPTGYVEAAGDCDDDCDACRPGGTEICDERDNDCDGTDDEGVTTTYYADCDGDGYAASGATTRAACSTPAPAAGCSGGWTTRVPSGASSTDCRDVNADVHPGAGFHAGAIPGVGGASARYDWNCDGLPERRWTDGFYCSTSCSGAGWVDTVPGCGGSALWRECGYTGGSCGYLFNGTKAQECR